MTKIEEMIVKYQTMKIVWEETTQQHRRFFSKWKNHVKQVDQFLDAVVSDFKSLNEETAKDLPDNKKRPDWMDFYHGD